MRDSFKITASLTLGLSAFLLASGCATTAAEAARGQWYSVSTPRFQVWTDGDPQLARGMVEDLERYHQVALRTTTAEDRENVFGPDDAAISILHEAAPDDPGVLRSLARAHWLRAEREQGDRTAALREARHFLQRAQKLEPANPEGLTLVGHLLRLEAIEAHKREPTKGEDELKGARNAYRKAIRSDDSLGEAYYGLGLTYLISDNRSEEAVTVLEVAAFLLPLDAEIAWSLAQLHLQRGNKEKAVPALEYVVRWGQSEQQRAKARGALADMRSSLGAAAVEPASGKR
jgi:tetratricopeptide (TPR) repeat protein